LECCNIGTLEYWVLGLRLGEKMGSWVIVKIKNLGLFAPIGIME